MDEEHAGPARPAGAVRVAMRVVLLDHLSRVRLFEGRDLADPSDTDRWWFAAGGGIEPGESLENAARRELQEETGLTGLDVLDLEHRQEARFMNHGTPLRQVEHFFAAGRPTTTSRWRDGPSSNAKQCSRGGGGASTS